MASLVMTSPSAVTHFGCRTTPRSLKELKSMDGRFPLHARRGDGQLRGDLSNCPRC
ncbi:hypothetical protein CBM2606_A180123 [Cupriavidus taiwanensis]|nr:hypothetical protein CBM2606_A180123 [Cupriavidus taiwanensis]